MSNPIEDYINNLEGKENLDAVAIARDLRELAGQEIGTREAKINELNGTIAEKDEAVSKIQRDLESQKARNFDLAMQVPGTNVKPSNHPMDDERVDSHSITIRDLFNPKVRNSNPTLRNPS